MILNKSELDENFGFEGAANDLGRAMQDTGMMIPYDVSVSFNYEVKS